MRNWPSTISAWYRSQIGALEWSLLGLLIGATYIFGRANSFEWFYAQTRAHEDWQLDEVANVFFLATICLSILLAVRARKLSIEMQRRTRAEAEANALARHDPLTGIANRRLFGEELSRNISASTRSGLPFAVYLVDLNRFKAVNDVYGHLVGDKLLIEVAKRLQMIARKEDTLARLGGDEFGLAAVGMSKDDALRLANRMIAAIEEPFDLGGIVIGIGACVGIALFPDDGSDTEALLLRSDMAMYRAKAAGGSGHAFFDAAIDEALRDREILQTDLKAAVGTDAIVPYYQSMVDLADGRIYGFEVLARWNHPSRGILPPEAFIPIAEDMRLIDELSMGLLRRALKDAAAWSPELILSLNIAPDQFRNRHLAETILGILAAAGFPPNRIEIELTETALVDDLAAAKTIIEELKQAGVRIAIDDFGKGYSSLYYLRELPFDVVKIDQSFVSSRQTNPESAKIVSAVIGLSGALGLSTVAEGVELKADADWLRDQGCTKGQGFLYSRPVAAADVPRLLPGRLAA